ncbi:hypothetical protein K469DRAFT_689432 [Zopfia rhizophila CBS 207.26]|uniref:Transcription factor hoxa13 n=1 Tax=Zopfia rhizophila CBS 207.26 TaxID=1314779 RepID=A0A6A6DYG4_9PEZI|nr:hypothetical protein K469DRAFT_689432 [Zopfia rhizophila CBS 207.26]
MAAQSNGRAKKPKKSTPNGHLNGQIDKISNPLGRPAQHRKQSKSIGGSSINVIGRLLSWYILITIFFRCPSSISHLSEASPQICKPYLHIRSYVAPYLDPYYQIHIAPQVEKVQPYVDSFDAQVYTPLASFAKDKYSMYGAHRVDQAQKYLEAEWDKTIRPRLENARTRATGQYNLYLAPHIKQASDVVTPYYEQIKDSMLEIYHLTLLPTYEAVLPYSQQGYAHGHHLVVHIIFPHVRSVKDISVKFITRTLWPQLRILYGDNVEPQLVRIRERLGRYKDEKKIESVINAVESETSTVSSMTSIPAAIPSGVDSDSASEILAAIWSDETETPQPSDLDTPTKVQPPQPKLTGEELREKLSNDLRKWQTKFATAADKGAEDLEQRVAEITKTQIENGVKGHGAALVIQLEETTKSTVSNFKDYIKQTVGQLPEDPTEEQLESAYEQCVAQTRALGLAVKEKAQAVRTWKTAYDEETDSLVKSAVDNTLAVLDRIHDLGLQEVGLRWAWTDGVTYKDWQNYHRLRNTLTEWEAEVEAVGAKHEGLKLAHEEAKKVEDEAMAISSKMVTELVRLKEVSRWKIWAEDATDDFSDRKVPARAFKAAKDVVSNVEEAASKASESIVGSQTSSTESVASALKDQVVGASSKLSESIIGSGTPAVQSAASVVEEKVAEASSKISDYIVGGEPGAESSVSDAAQSVISAAKDEKEEVEAAVSAASETPKKVLGGAMAQVLAEAKGIVFDDVIDDSDDTTYSEKVQSMVAEASGRAADLSRAVSEALLGPSKTQGTVESVTSLASEQYEKAIAAASSVLYGTEQQPIESMTSVTSEKFAQAVTAASYAIYGAPTPTTIIKTVRIEASSRYNNAVSQAKEQYSNAKSQLSELISGTPKPAHETMLSMIEKAYSDSVAAASEKLQAALQYTDSVKSYAAGPTQGYFESVSSVASSKLSEGLSQASAQFASQPTGTPALEETRRRYYEGIGLAHARYSEFLDAASSAVYGPQQGTVESLASVVSESAASVASQVSEAAESVASHTSSSVIGIEDPRTESIASQASQNWEALIAKASTQVYGAPTPWTESIYSQAGIYGAQATAQAAEQYAAVQALISELIVGKEPDFTESIMNRFSSAYYTGIPAIIASANSYASDNLDAASSYAGESYEAATSYAAGSYASASSVVSSIFTPPPAIETVLSQANEQINSVVESASIAIYGTPKGKIEQASESAASAYSSIQSQASKAIYGTQQAQDSFAAVAASAQAAISEAIFGTPTPTRYVSSVTSGAESTYSSISSVASEKAVDASSAISSAIYGPEQGAMESASSRLAAVVEVANSRISELYASAAKSAEDAVSSVSSVATEATQRVKDEL